MGWAAHQLYIVNEVHIYNACKHNPKNKAVIPLWQHM